MVENAAARAVRLLDLVPYLNSHPGASVVEVAKEFGISKQELMKDLNLLFVCGLPGYTPLELIDLSFEDGIVVVTDPQNLDAPRTLTEQEALVLRIALAGLEDSVPASHKMKVSELRRKVAEIFKSEIPDGAISYRGAKERDILRTIESAIQSNKKVEIEYLNPSQNRLTKRRVSPSSLEFGKSRTLMTGWCDLANGVRTFNIANIESIELLAEIQIQGADSENEDSYRAILEGSNLAWFMRENEAAIQVTGSNRYEIDIFQEEWLLRSTLASAGEIRIVGPKRASERVKALAENALKNYR